MIANTKNKNNNLLYSILILTFFAYLPSLFCDFTNWDDGINVTQNPFISEFSFHNIKAIFSQSFAGMYVPLTMISYTFDNFIGGLDPLIFHLSNLILHLLNILLLYKLIINLTNKKNAALIVALLFALHPMNTESVVWISTRSNLLFTLFYFLSLNAYIEFVKQKNQKFFIHALLFFLLSLLSKSQALTLPVILFLIDFWFNRKINKNIFIEKIPFFLLLILFGILTILFREEAGHINPAAAFSIFDRFILSAYSIGIYIVKFIAPIRLNAFYPIPEKEGILLPAEYTIYAVFVIIALIIFVKHLNKNRTLTFGILFFLISISVVALKIIPFGHQVIAERYGYLSYAGFFFIAGFYLEKIFAEPVVLKKIHINKILLVLLFFYTILLGLQTFLRIDVWKNSISLYSDIIRKNPGIALPYYNRALAKAEEEDYSGAEKDLTMAIHSKHYLSDDVPKFYLNRGNVFKKLGKFERALSDYHTATSLNPMYFEAFNNIGNLKMTMNDFQGAKIAYEKALSLNPDFSTAHTQLGMLYIKNKDTINALTCFNKALISDSLNTDALYNRGIILILQKKFSDALKDFSLIIAVDPTDAQSWYNSGLIKSNLGRNSEACEDLQQAARLGFKPAQDAMAAICK
ncbi:MAG: hypothetical protein A2275_15995 [Bacteroidetes bacterium RIFOXYA12_FULL_35_11]|nr:MAG: hypothetical protein A2X01_15110 [Bacteroidetes bacterium GWF2_35_48]OFY76567.1 MAG: hypothetical protein A2275_15995 [Bacteroidetes bacterium RIFOXYA12_FULL_35_11]HBX52318.1 hypothetical protein [Bacteroidales bacterium]